MLEENMRFHDYYKIKKCIGKGGMGKVWLAEDMRDHSVWAMKEQANTSNARNEGRLLSSFHHSALPSLHEVFVEGDRLFIVMGYMEGCSISSFIEEKITQKDSFSEDQILLWFRQIGEILEYLHSLDPPVVYKDLKPRNIIVSPGGDIQLVDFGIASEYTEDHLNDKGPAGLTKGYAAPEQYSLKYAADVRTDIYSLGATMHYLLTLKNPAQPPFKFEPVRKLDSTRSLAIEEIVEKCLQPEPEKRYASAEELLDALDHVKSREPELKQKTRQKRIRVIFICLLFFIVAAVSFTLTRMNRNRAQDRYLTLVQQAKEAISDKEFDKAEGLLEEAEEINSESKEAHIVRADLYYERGDTELAAQYVELELMAKYDDLYTNEDFKDLLEKLEDAE